jgi:glycosyltransferase involved in cell wall biosynthesis
MAKAVVGTARVRNGLKGELPYREAKSPAQWADAVVGLWRDKAKRDSLGRAARAWVCEHHTWAAAAGEAAAGIRAALAEKAAAR